MPSGHIVDYEVRRSRVYTEFWYIRAVYDNRAMDIVCPANHIGLVDRQYFKTLFAAREEVACLNLELEAQKILRRMAGAAQNGG